MRYRHTWIAAVLAVILAACSSGASDETTTSTTAGAPETTTTAAAADPATSPEIAAWCEIRQETYEYDMDDPAALEAAMTQSLAFLLARTEAAPPEIADAVQVRADEFSKWVDALESANWRFENLPEPEQISEEEGAAINAADEAILAFELEHCGFDSREEGPVGN